MPTFCPGPLLWINWRFLRSGHGPPFLLGGRRDWPKRLHYDDPSLELRKQVLMVKSLHVDITLRSKYGNSFPSMQRVFTYIYKFSCATWDIYALVRRPTGSFMGGYKGSTFKWHCKEIKFNCFALALHRCIWPPSSWWTPRKFYTCV